MATNIVTALRKGDEVNVHGAQRVSLSQSDGHYWLDIDNVCIFLNEELADKIVEALKGMKRSERRKGELE